MKNKTINQIPQIEKKQRILIAPLNWGLGHASRCIPLIKELQRQGHEIIVAADGYPFQLLKSEISDAEFIHFEGIKIRYSKSNCQIGAIALCLPNILRSIKHEHEQLKEIVKKHHISIVLSDNRFGLWTNNVKSIYVTHQLMIKMPKLLKFLEKTAWELHQWIISHYNECWIPDYTEAPGLSGDLSHKYPLPRNARFIGPLSRFSETEAQPLIDDNYDNVIIISGVEPQRTLFEKQMIKKFEDLEETSLIVRGLPQSDKNEIMEEKYLTIVNSLSSGKMKTALLNAKHIYCRSGYSSIMDLNILGKKATLIPTPGQPEQEYLATIN